MGMYKDKIRLHLLKIFTYINMDLGSRYGLMGHNMKDSGSLI